MGGIGVPQELVVPGLSYSGSNTDEDGHELLVDSTIPFPAPGNPAWVVGP